MRPLLATVALVLLHGIAGHGQAVPSPPTSFDVATIRAVDPPLKSGRYLTMQGTHRFVARNFTLRLLLAAAYDVNPIAITGGPGWIDTDKFDIEAVTPGDGQPTRPQQMRMLSTLLTERFQLALHREQKQFPIYVLTVLKSGARLKAGSASATDPSSVVSTVYPDHVLMPARNASMGDFVAVLQRAILDRPVVDHTGLAGRYDFDLKWTPGEREFGGELQLATSDTSSPPLVVALQEQLGLKLEATRGPAAAIVIDRVEKPSSN